MSVLYIVIPLAIVIVAVAVGAFAWATHRGQFDDLDTPGMRMLHDDGVRGGRGGEERGEERGEGIR